MFETIIEFFSTHVSRSLGLLVFLVAGYLAFSEFRVYRKHNTSLEQFVLWLMATIGGLVTFVFNDIVLGFLLAITVLMVYETYELRDAPVWGKLMLATTASYMVILVGKITQMIVNYYTLGTLTAEDERIFATSFNIFIFVFFLMAFLFFGKQFILVSRLSSPQIVYLFLFAFVYLGIAQFRLRNFDYLNIADSFPADRILFLTFGTYEALVLSIIFMYFISGWLLNVLFGVKPVEDPVLLAKVKDVATTMGIEEDLKVGYVEAPILNAFAYGPFFDKRIAFISSDLSDFKDSDIRGIVGHELAHASKHHTFILLVISIGEVILKKALGLPASQLDYSFFADDLGVTFFQYFLINYGLVIVLYVFVRALEGHADKVTKDAGYGEDLGKALFRLEGFYQGVASDFGISVNLLTNKQYSDAERQRFTAAAGRTLYQEFIKPKRFAAFSNIFVSHPRTSYRLASLLRDDISPIRAAFFPYNILGLLQRKSSIKKLNDVRNAAANLINETYNSDFSENALLDVHKYNPIIDQSLRYKGKHVLAFDPLEKILVQGQVSDVLPTNLTTTPIKMLINDQEVFTDNYVVKEFTPDTQYVLKSGALFTAKSYENDEKKGILIHGVLEDGEEHQVPITEFGISVEYIQEKVGKKMYVYNMGSATLYNLESFSTSDSWELSQFNITRDGEDPLRLFGKDIIVGFPPIGVLFKREKTADNLEVLKGLINQKVALYTKDNYDVPVAGIVKTVNSEMLVLENRDGSHEVLMPKLEYIVSYEDTLEIYEKDKLSLYDRFIIWWDNRNKFQYIVG